MQGRCGGTASKLARRAVRAVRGRTVVALLDLGARLADEHALGEEERSAHETVDGLRARVGTLIEHGCRTIRHFRKEAVQLSLKRRVVPLADHLHTQRGPMIAGENRHGCDTGRGPKRAHSPGRRCTGPTAARK